MQVPSEWEIPEDLRQRVADRVGRQRALHSDGHLLLVLHKVPLPGKPERQGILFWRRPSGEWFANETGEGLRVLSKQIEAYANAVDAQEAGFEVADSAAAYHEILQAIGPLHRAAEHMHLVLQSARELFKDDAELASLTDWSYETSRAADLLNNDTRNAMDYELARQAALQVESSRRLAVVANRLNIIAALFLPLMAFASLFGMNLRSGLDEKHPGVFWGVLLVGVVLGLLVALFALRVGMVVRSRNPRAKKHWNVSETKR